MLRMRDRHTGKGVSCRADQIAVSVVMGEGTWVARECLGLGFGTGGNCEMGTAAPEPGGEGAFGELPLKCGGKLMPHHLQL